MTIEPYKSRVLLAKIRELIKQNRYRTTAHFQLREKQRDVFLWEALYVLSHGSHEPERDEWDQKHQRWSYAIHGRTMETRELRVIVSILEPLGLLLVTVYDLNQRRQGNGKKS